MNRDLTVGNADRVLYRFCLPLLGSVVFQQLYNIADSLVAGKFVGQNALAAVGNSYEIALLFIAFSFGINIGCSVVVSRFFGSRSIAEMKTAVYTTFIAGGAVCLLLMPIGLLLCPELLNLINTPAEIFDDSRLYLVIYIFGFPFMVFYNVANGIFSALGDSRTPFIFLAASSLSNIGADILFVTAFNMGIAGVAWATFICQGISCLFAVIFVLRRLKSIKTEKKPRVFSWSILRKISVIAVPSILQQSFVSVGNIIIQSVINTFDVGVIAGYSAAIKLNNLIVTSLVTLSNGVSNFTAQNIGAHRLSRIGEGFKAGVKMVWIICIPLVAAYLAAGSFFVYMFLDNPTGPAIDTGVLFLRIVAPFYFIISVKLIADGVLRGAGKMLHFMISTFVDLIIRTVLALILSASMGSVGIWISWPIGWTVATVLSYVFYRMGGWSRIKTQEQQQANT